MNMTTKLVALCAVLTSLAVTAAPGQGGRPPAPPKGGRPAANAPARPARGGGAHAAPVHGGRRVIQIRPADRSGLSREDRHLIDKLEDADTLDQLMHLYQRARASREAQVREALISALEDQGERAVNLLAGLIADPDPDVSESAFSSWSSIVEDMRPRKRIAAMIEAAAALQQQMTPPPPPPAMAPGAVPVPAVPAVPVQAVPVAPAQPVAPAVVPAPVPAPVVVQP